MKGRFDNRIHYRQSINLWCFLTLHSFGAIADELGKIPNDRFEPETEQGISKILDSIERLLPPRNNYTNAPLIWAEIEGIGRVTRPPTCLFHVDIDCIGTADENLLIPREAAPYTLQPFPGKEKVKQEVARQFLSVFRDDKIMVKDHDALNCRVSIHERKMVETTSGPSMEWHRGNIKAYTIRITLAPEAAMFTGRYYKDHMRDFLNNLIPDLQKNLAERRPLTIQTPHLTLAGLRKECPAKPIPNTRS